MTPEQLETKIDELKYHFDENFGKAVGRREEKMLAFKYKRDDKEQAFVAEEFQKHLALKGFESEIRRRKFKDAPVEIWVDLTFNYG